MKGEIWWVVQWMSNGRFKTWRREDGEPILFRTRSEARRHCANKSQRPLKVAVEFGVR